MNNEKLLKLVVLLAALMAAISLVTLGAALLGGVTFDVLFSMAAVTVLVLFGLSDYPIGPAFRRRRREHRTP